MVLSQTILKKLELNTVCHKKLESKFLSKRKLDALYSFLTEFAKKLNYL